MPGAGGAVSLGGGWRTLHLLPYLAEMAAQSSMLPSVVVYVSWGEWVSRGKGGADAIKQAICQMLAFLANMSIRRSSFQIARAVGQ